MGIRYVKFTFFAKHTIVFLIFPGLIETLPAFVGMFFQESPAKKAGGTRTLVPFHDDQQVFVLISRIGFRNINFSFFLSVFMCSWHFLVFSKHCQHKCEYTIKKSPKKWGGTRVLVPRHQNSDALSSWQLVFYCNLENGHQEYQFVFFPQVYLCVLNIFWLYQNTASKN